MRRSEDLSGQRGWSVPFCVRWSNVQRLRRPLVVIGAAVSVIVGAVAVIYVARGTGPMQYFDDPAVVMGGSPFAGSVSTLGNFLWIAAATASLMAVAAARQRRDGRRSLLLAVGVASLVLGFDDQFMFHERLLARDLGLAELWLTAPYAVTAAWVAVKQRSVILNHPDGLALILGGGLLALSLGIDIGHADIAGRATAEEAAKFAGIAFWCLFAFRAGMRLIRDAYLDSAQTDAGEVSVPAAIDEGDTGTQDMTDGLASRSRLETTWRDDLVHEKS